MLDAPALHPRDLLGTTEIVLILGFYRDELEENAGRKNTCTPSVFDGFQIADDNSHNAIHHIIALKRRFTGR